MTKVSDNVLLTSIISGCEKAKNEERIENNRRIFATYSREKLIQFIRDTVGWINVGKKKLTDFTDEELRELALAITGGP